MSTFNQDLLQRVVKSLLPQQEKNPLRTIGLSFLILKLGLSDDELYEYCKDMARTLVVHFHPDRVGIAPTDVELQKRFSEAFQALKDREVFDRALLEFKYQHNEVTSEGSAEKRNLKTHVDLLEEARVRIGKAESLARTNDQQVLWLREKFFSNLRLRGASLSKEVASDLKAIGIQQAVRLNLLVFNPYHPCTLPRPAIVRKYLDDYSLVTKQKGWSKDKQDKFRGSLTGANIGSARVSDLIRKALESEELFPAVNWSSSDGYRRLGLKRFDTGNHFRHESVTPSKTNLTLEQLSVLYRNALASVGSLMASRTEGVSDLSIRLKSVEVNRGRIKFGPHDYPMLGTLRIEDINPLLFHLRAETNVPDELALDKLQPLLTQGDLLVWQSRPTIYTLKKGKSTADRLRDASNSSLSGLNVSCVVLEAIAGDFD